MTNFTRHEKQANCEACTLANVLKDCPACAFYIEYPRVIPEDVMRIWKQLWGNSTPEQVAYYSDMTGGEQYDRTQLTDAEIAELPAVNPTALV